MPGSASPPKRTVPVAPPDRRLRLSRWTASTAFAAQGLLFAVLLTHVPQFKDRYGFGDGVITLVILAVSLLAGVGSVISESIARRLSSAVSLRFGLLWLAIAAAVIAVPGGRVLFILSFALYGVGLGAVDAGTNMQAVSVQTAYGRSILTSCHACWSAGAIVGALYVSVGERLGLGLSPSIAIVAAAVAVFVLFGSAGLYVDTAAGPATLVSNDPAQPLIPWRPVLLLGAAMVCFYVTDAGAGSWATTYSHDVLRASSALAPVAYAAYQATAFVSRVLGDQAVRRFGIERTVRIGALIGVAGLLAVVFSVGPWPAIVGFAVAGLGLPVVAPLCFSACAAIAPGFADQVVARVNVFNYLGSIVGGVAVGGIGAASSLRWGFLVPAVLALVLLGLAPAFAPTTARSAAPDGRFADTEQASLRWDQAG